MLVALITAYADNSHDFAGPSFRTGRTRPHPLPVTARRGRPDHRVVPGRQRTRSPRPRCLQHPRRPPHHHQRRRPTASSTANCSGRSRPPSSPATQMTGLPSTSPAQHAARPARQTRPRRHDRRSRPRLSAATQLRATPSAKHRLLSPAAAMVCSARAHRACSGLSLDVRRSVDAALGPPRLSGGPKSAPGLGRKCGDAGGVGAGEAAVTVAPATSNSGWWWWASGPP